MDRSRTVIRRQFLLEAIQTRRATRSTSRNFGHREAARDALVVD
jgi:hypothetical protein